MATSLAATSGAYAHEQTSTALRGSYVTVELQATCQEGWEAGEKAIKDLWKAGGSNCNDIWSLQNEANAVKTKRFPPGGDWQTSSYNECARNGVDAQVAKTTKKCIGDDSTQCIELGNAAAEHVVMNNFCTPGNPDAFRGEPPNYKVDCKAAATSICEGQIPSMAKRWFPSKSMSTSKLVELQGKCKRQVDSMVPGVELEFME